MTSKLHGINIVFEKMSRRFRSMDPTFIYTPRGTIRELPDTDATRIM